MYFFSILFHLCKSLYVFIGWYVCVCVWEGGDLQLLYYYMYMYYLRETNELLFNLNRYIN